jgi:hypothetical protein
LLAAGHNVAANNAPARIRNDKELVFRASGNSLPKTMPATAAVSIGATVRRSMDANDVILYANVVVYLRLI